MGYSGAGGKLIDEKNQKQKISLHCPFNVVADMLSCPASGITTARAAPCCAAITNRAPFDLRDMGLRQIHCTQAQSLRSSKELRIVMQKVGNLDLLCDAASALSDPWYQGTSADRFCTNCNALHTQVYEPLAMSLPPGTYGRDSLNDVTAWVRACLHC